jgi:VIT1/CCC1 family predicted Fe2+/Mn2+ transporter
MKEVSDEQLAAEHSAAAISARLEKQGSHGDLGDFVLGAVDGTITTFAIICGVAGSGMEQGVAVAFILGLANVVADGFSMGASNYLKARSDLQTIQNCRQMEEMHIARRPDFEREEIRQIFALKGFSGRLLDEIVKTISRDERLWVDRMLTEEWGLHLSPIRPLRSALFTFLAFIGAGLIPLLPLLLGLLPK